MPTKVRLDGLGTRPDLHVQWLGRDDNNNDLGYIAVAKHPGNAFADYCAKCIREKKTGRPSNK